MSAGVFLAVLFAAFLHAGWNALIKTGGDPFQAMFTMSSAQGLMGVIMLLFLPAPAGAVWPWLIASGVIHSCYKLFLASAYEHGDLSRVYPVARGAAPMIVLAVGAFVLADELDAMDYPGVVVIGCGVILMARGIFGNGESRRMLPWALPGRRPGIPWSMGPARGSAVTRRSSSPGCSRWTG